MAACDQQRIPPIWIGPHTLHCGIKVGISSLAGCVTGVLGRFHYGCAIEGSGIGVDTGGKGVRQTRGCGEGGVELVYSGCCN
jgi:hypothetical protein